MKTYSVVIPCYNCSTSIVRAIESVSKQTIKPQQIICVDNNSKDNTFEILNQIKEQLPGIIVVQEFNQGASFARNKGVTYVTSDYVQFLDADDLLLENKVKQQLELLQDIEYTELPLIVEGFVSKVRITQSGKTHLIGNETWEALIRGKLGYTVSNLWPTNLFKELKGFDTNLKTSEEYDLLFKILKKNPSILISDNINTVKINDNISSLTQTNQIDNWERFLQLRLKILDYLEESRLMRANHYLAIFDTLRIAYRYIPQLSKEIYKKRLKGKFIPQITEVTSRKYLMLFNVFGFPISDRILTLHKIR